MDLSGMNWSITDSPMKEMKSQPVGATISLTLALHDWEKLLNSQNMSKAFWSCLPATTAPLFQALCKSPQASTLLTKSPKLQETKEKKKQETKEKKQGAKRARSELSPTSSAHEAQVANRVRDEAKSTSDGIMAYRLEMAFDNPVVSHKPWTLRVVTHKGTFLLPVKLGRAPVKRRGNTVNHVSKCKFRRPRGTDASVLLVAIEEGSFLCDVTTRGGQTQGRTSQRYCNIRQHGTYELHSTVPITDTVLRVWTQGPKRVAQSYPLTMVELHEPTLVDSTLTQRGVCCFGEEWSDEDEDAEWDGDDPTSASDGEDDDEDGKDPRPSKRQRIHRAKKQEEQEAWVPVFDLSTPTPSASSSSSSAAAQLGSQVGTGTTSSTSAITSSAAESTQINAAAPWADVLCLDNDVLLQSI